MTTTLNERIAMAKEKVTKLEKQKKLEKRRKQIADRKKKIVDASTSSAS